MNDSTLFSVNPIVAAVGTPIEYISPSFTADWPFNGIGLQWSGSITTTQPISFALAIDDGPWQNLHLTNNEAKDQLEQFTSLPLFQRGRTVRYKIIGDSYQQVRNVKLIYFDSTIPPLPSMLQSLRATLTNSLASDSTTANNTANPSIITRADWGADETWRTWEPDYRTPKKFVIHHTAAMIRLPQFADYTIGKRWC